MSGSSFGRLFQVSTFGESHGFAIGCIVDGCPPLLEISELDIQNELDRRRPGQSTITTPRTEEDRVEILSGVFEGKTTGAPICLLIKNKDQKSSDYDDIKDIFRPGHADFTYEMKYGIRDYRGGGRSSARETIARVAAGAIAKKFLKQSCETEFFAFVQQIGKITSDFNLNDLTRSAIESEITRCPDKIVSKKMIQEIEKAKESGDSLGGIIKCLIKNPPANLGEPCFDKISALLSYAIMSINAVKGFDIGDGFESVSRYGSENNDEMFVENGKMYSKNKSGGVLGGISTGEDIYFRAFFKPTSTIKKEQCSINKNIEEVKISVTKGRHDPCVLPRAVPIVEAMAALTIMDLFLINKGIYDRNR